jgi:gas vesicle protein
MFNLYKNYQRENDKKILLSTIIGAVVGSMITLFISPVKGRDARKIVANRVQKFTENIEEGIDDTKRKASNKLSQISSQLEEKGGEAKRETTNAINSARNKIADKIEK